jgi:2-phosphosulfolactate phosphatase
MELDRSETERMDIKIHSLLTGAEQAMGSVAIIDVLRAFTTAAVAIANGASQITMVSAVEEALRLRALGIGQVCMGEVGGQAPPGFDFGNSPSEIKKVDFTGKSIIQRTSAGTQGIVAACRAKHLYATSLVTANATARSLRSKNPDRVTLVAMGKNAVERTDEDELCALHLRNLLEGRPGDPDAVRRLILAGAEAERFRSRILPHLYPDDLDIALDIDRYDFALKIQLEDNRPVARSERTE